jgi:hypothetical protein
MAVPVVIIIDYLIMAKTLRRTYYSRAEPLLNSFEVSTSGKFFQQLILF